MKKLLVLILSLTLLCASAIAENVPTIQIPSDSALFNAPAMPPLEEAPDITGSALKGGTLTITFAEDAVFTYQDGTHQVTYQVSAALLADGSLRLVPSSSYDHATRTASFDLGAMGLEDAKLFGVHYTAAMTEDGQLMQTTHMEKNLKNEVLLVQAQCPKDGNPYAAGYLYTYQPSNGKLIAVTCDADAEELIWSAKYDTDGQLVGFGFTAHMLPQAEPEKEEDVSFDVQYDAEGKIVSAQFTDLLMADEPYSFTYFPQTGEFRDDLPDSPSAELAEDAAEITQELIDSRMALLKSMPTFEITKE